MSIPAEVGDDHGNPGPEGSGAIATDAKASTERRPPIRLYAYVLIGALLFALFLRAFVVHAYRIPSASMEDTLLIGDYLLAERITYGTSVELPWSDRPLFRPAAVRQPERGDIVIFRSWNDSGQEFIKRCVALAGDTVAVVGNRLLVNGMSFDSSLSCRFPAGEGALPQIKYLSRDDSHVGLWHVAKNLHEYGPHVVKRGHIFVMGDNRDNSDDSRVKGDLPLSALRGRPLFIYWSVAREGGSWNPFTRVRWSRIGRVLE